MSYHTMTTSPGLGWFERGEDQGYYPNKKSAVGSLSSVSKHLGDGGWCENCRSLGWYTWLDEHVKRRDMWCERCHTRRPRITNKD